MLYNKTIFKRCFCYRPRYWYKNLAQIPEYFRQLHFLMKHGYDICALWSFDWWFCEKVKEMLIKFREDHHCIPPCEIEDGFKPESNEDWEKQGKLWDAYIDRLIFLLGEMNEETCSRKNPYFDEWSRVHKEFREKYGMFGEKLQTPEELKEYEEKGYKVWHMASELPENQEINQKYIAAEIEIEKYREDCKNEFFKLLSKHFYYLWD